MSEPPGPRASRRGSWFPSAKTVGNFVLDVIGLKNTVAALRDQSKDLKQQIDTLQRQVDEQAGQIAIIREFMTTAINETAARSGERAAMQAIRALLENKRDREP